MRVEHGIRSSNWNDIREQAAWAESRNYDGVVTFELNNDPFMSLAIATAATQHVRLGTAIAVCFPRSPMVVAYSAWDLHTQSSGRFTLGLGTQVKGHNERRFSVPWTAPQPRLREYIEAVRAIWRCWENNEPLDYQGEHYQFTLMTPEFSPAKSNLDAIPVTIAAVGPAMMRLAGQTCDGVRLHPFATRKYITEVALPEIESGLVKSGRDRSSFEVWGGGFVAIGADQKALTEAREDIRARIAFYGSTRTYLPVLALHGWEDLGATLHQMSRQGLWNKMAAEVPDHVVDEFSIIAPPDELIPRVRERFEGQTDTIALDFSPLSNENDVRQLVSEIHDIDSQFKQFSKSW